MSEAAAQHHDAATAAVAENLHDPFAAEGMQPVSTVAHESMAGHNAPDPAIGGAGGYLNATTIVSLAMLIFIVVLIWKKVPALIAKVLDDRIATIRTQLGEASSLRAEAEALKAQYEGKLAAVTGEAEALRARAQEDAAQILSDAEANAAALVVRRQKMAEDKIAAAERAAIADIRARAVKAATLAAATLIEQKHDAKADKGLVDSAIKGLGVTA
ncbi:MAG: F0F1 ATP synthase subunit B [Sphingobium sp.]